MGLVSCISHWKSKGSLVIALILKLPEQAGMAGSRINVACGFL